MLKPNCDLIHNFPLKNTVQKIREFQKCLNIFKNNFMLFEPYESKIIGSSKLDLLFISIKLSQCNLGSKRPKTQFSRLSATSKAITSTAL